MSDNKMQSMPVLRSKTVETLKRESRRISELSRVGATRPDSSIRHPIIAQAFKPSPSDPFPTSADTPASIQQETSESEPPETDPQATKLLWWKVEQALRKKRGAYHRMPFDKPTQTTGDKRAMAPLSIDPPSSNIETSTASKQLAKACADDVQFRDLVLHARGIRNNETDQIVLGGPYELFHTSAPAGLHSVHYMVPHPHSNIWLDISSSGAAVIVNQYLLGEAQNETEEFFSDLAKKYLLKHDPLEDPRLEETSRRTYRKSKWDDPSPTIRRSRPFPPQQHSQQQVTLPVHVVDGIKYPLPPLIPTTKPAASRPYEFRLNPDMTYYLSLKAVDHKYRDKISLITPVQFQCAIAAYFTIQFKKDKHSEEQAQNQATAASAMWLYHRVILRQKRLAAEKADPSASHFDDLKHYAMTLRGPSFTFWVTVPTMSADGTWKGCTMRKLFNANLRSEEKVMRFAQWVNEIHNWGLGPWADGFVDDVKTVMRKS
ncbi:hypothetical protein MMC31_002727 [Peltigera leucophlebia]|nr:hypothetical protein [Peltigera leucophlebia]